MNEIQAQVLKIVGRFAKNKAAVETATAETRIRKDLGVSSANLVDIVLDMEEAFDVSIGDDELATIATVGDAVAAIESKKNAAAA